MKIKSLGSLPTRFLPQYDENPERDLVEGLASGSEIRSKVVGGLTAQTLRNAVLLALVNEGPQAKRGIS